MNQATLGLYDDYGMMGMNGGLMGFNPAFCGMNYDSYFKQMQDYQNFTARYQLQTAQNQRNNDIAINAPMESIQGTASVLNEKIVSNEQDYIQGAWNSYVEAVKNAYPDADEKTIIARAKNHYQQIYGTSITDDIRKFGNGSFKQGLYQALSFGLANRKTTEENIAELTGQPVPRSENTKRQVGRAVGGAVYGAAAGLIFGPVGAIVGGLVGAVGSVLLGLRKN